MTSQIPAGEIQFQDANGVPYAFGTVAMYTVNTLTPKNTWTNQAGTSLNTNPVVLDSAGRCIMWGTGLYRQILSDQFSNEIWDQTVSCSLPDSAISAVMLPVVGASTLAQARTLMGIDGEIAAAIDAIQLLPGPTGPAGPTGPTGPTGAAITGPTGPAGASGASGSIQCGTGTTDINGNLTVSFSVPFVSQIVGINVFGVLSPSIYDPIIGSYQVLSYSINGFVASVIDGNGGVLSNTPTAWYALGL
jgi:hypothetical protein